MSARAPLHALVAANTASLLGNVVAAVAIPWFVLVTTGSVTRTGVAAFATTLPLALVLLAVAGAADFVSAVLRSTIMLQVTPDAMRGRTSGIELAQVAGAPALGNLEAGVVASLLGIRFSIVSGGVACVLGTLAIAAALPAFRRYEKPRT